MNRIITLIGASLLCLGSSVAQLSQNPCKFLGNITTSYNWQEYCDPTECNGLSYAEYWNQVTCENACKWGSVHQGWGRFNWENADRTYNYCKKNGIMFKFHALIWGSQHPAWIESLSVEDTKKAIIEWFDEVKRHYPDLEIIDVVNEAIYSGNDYHSPYKQTKIIEALGGQANGYPNTQSYNWIAECFRMARERWPNAILIYNDYNTFQWQKNEFIDLVNGLKALNAPIDAAGCQSHDLNDMSGNDFKRALEDIHNRIQLPIYITEYDIAKDSDNEQKTRYSEQFPIMWEADYVAGVTLWGWIYGKTWVGNGNSGIVKNCQDRPAFAWLKEYMKSDKAKNAKSPICIGAKSGVTAKLSVSADAVQIGDEVKISVEASAKSGRVTQVEFYANDALIAKKDAAPYEYAYAPTEEGNITIKVIAYDSEGNTAEQTQSIIACKARTPYMGTMAELPGVIEAENFDEGCPGVAYYDTDDKDEGDANYRQEIGVDIVKGNGDNAIGYTATDEWLEYTVNVKKDGKYDVEAEVASGSENSSFKIQFFDANGKATSAPLAFSIPAGEDWDTYSTLKDEIELTAGEQIMRLTITGSYGNIDKLTFTNGDETGLNSLLNTSTKTFNVYTTLGGYVGSITINNMGSISNELYNLTQQEGTFVLRNAETNEAKLYISKK